MAASVTGMPAWAAVARISICRSACSPKRSWNPWMPSGRNDHDSVSRDPPSTGSMVKPHRTHPSLTTQANSRSGSAATTRLLVSHVRLPSSLRPVK